MSFLKSQGPSRKALVDTFVGAGTVGPFTLSRNPGTKAGIIVQVGAGLTGPETYTLSGNSITFSGPIEDGTKVYVYHLGVENAVDPNRTVTLREFTFVASAGQTDFSGPDKDGKVLSYRVGNLIVDVSGNTVQDTEDFDAVDGSEIIFKTGLAENAEVHIFSLPALDIANVYTKDEVAAMVSRMIREPLGNIDTLAGDTLPEGRLYTDGSAFSRTTYSDLFALIGVTFGEGDGSTTANLPNIPDQQLIEYGSNIAGTSTITSPYSGTGTLASMIDGDEGTWFRFSNNDTPYVEFEFPSAVVLNRYKFITAHADIQLTDSVRIQGSNDGSTWDTIDEHTISLTHPVTYEYSFENETAYTRYRLWWIQGTTSGPGFFEIELFTDVTRVLKHTIQAFHPTMVLAAEPEGLPKSGGVMTGPLRLVGDATLDDEAVTKRQMEAASSRLFAYDENSTKTDYASGGGYIASGYDGSVPLVTEGVEVVSVTFTPDYVGQKIELSGEITMANGSSSHMYAAIYDEAGNALDVSIGYNVAGAAVCLSPKVVLTAASVAETTVTMRAGANGGTITVNGYSGSAGFGGCKTTLTAVGH